MLTLRGSLAGQSIRAIRHSYGMLTEPRLVKLLPKHPSTNCLLQLAHSQLSCAVRDCQQRFRAPLQFYLQVKKKKKICSIVYNLSACLMFVASFELFSVTLQCSKICFSACSVSLAWLSLPSLEESGVKHCLKSASLNVDFREKQMRQLHTSASALKPNKWV